MILKDHGQLQSKYQTGMLVYYVFVGVRFEDNPYSHTMVRWRVLGSLLSGIICEREQRLISPKITELQLKYAKGAS